METKNIEKIVKNNILREDLKFIFDNHTSKKEFYGKKILLIGNKGFLGKYLSNYFIYYFKKLKINKLIFLDIANKKNISKNIIYLKADVRKSMSFLSKYKPDIIMHAATIASPIYYRQNPIGTALANVDGLKAILDYSKKNSNIRTLFFSSSEIYGNPDNKNIPTKEDYNGNVSCIGPRACYDESKRFCETLAYVYSKKFKLNINVVRPFNNFGPGLSIYDGRLPADMANAAINKKTFKIFSNGKPTRTFCYVSDAIIGYLNTFKLKGFNVLNIGNPNNEVSILKFTKIFSKCAKEVLKIKTKIEFKRNYDEEYLIDSPQRRCPNINLAKKIIKFNPKINLNNGIKRYLEYLKYEKENNE